MVANGEDAERTEVDGRLADIMHFKQIHSYLLKKIPGKQTIF